MTQLESGMIEIDIEEYGYDEFEGDDGIEDLDEFEDEMLDAFDADEAVQRFTLPPTWRTVGAGFWLIILIGGLMAAGMRVIPIVMVPSLGGAAIAAFVIGRYVWMWGWRIPRYFEVTPAGLTIVWPMRRRTVSIDEITEVRLVDKEAIGLAGGDNGWTPFESFGPTQCDEFGMVEMYATKYADCALVRLHSGMALLIGVYFADEFVEALWGQIRQS